MNIGYLTFIEFEFLAYTYSWREIEWLRNILVERYGAIVAGLDNCDKLEGCHAEIVQLVLQ